MQVIPPALRLTTLPLHRGCAKCKYLTRNGGSCPGIVPGRCEMPDCCVPKEKKVLDSA